jgi:hypothetical protein
MALQLSKKLLAFTQPKSTLLYIQKPTIGLYLHRLFFLRYLLILSELHTFIIHPSLEICQPIFFKFLIFLISPVFIFSDLVMVYKPA